MAILVGRAGMGLARAVDARALVTGMIRVVRARLTPERLDDALAAGVMAAGAADVAVGSIGGNPTGLMAAFVVVVAAALAVRRRAPLVPPVVLGVGELALTIAGRHPVSDLWGFVVLLVVGYSVAAYADRRQALVGVAVLFAGVVVAQLNTSSSRSEDVLSPIVLVTLPWLAGRLARRYGEQARELAAANRELEQRRAAEVERALEQERTHIAQELHDVIAHSLSVMVVQAGAAESLAAGGPATEPIAAIRRTGKAALAEMRRLLGVLRTEVGTRPQPGIAELDAMVERIRAAGVAVDLAVDPDLPALQPGPDLVVFRVVQEALTNTLKHAGSSSARVSVAYDGHAVAIEAVDSGGPGGPGDGSGHGLLGMRERLALYDGTLESGPAGHGWRIRARLPVGTEALR